MPVFKTVTLGCKVNQYETEYFRQGLLRAGMREAVGDEPADLCIVNTCTVTLESDYKSRKIIRALSRENPRTEIIVMGCYATRAPDDVAHLPRVLHVLTDKRRLPELVAAIGRIDAPEGISSFDRLHRAYVKVQDGCTMECTYCIVPKVRPNLTSRPVQHVVDEVRRLVDAGHREIVLTGIHLGFYGVDLPRNGHPRVGLAQMVRQVLQIDGDFRVRLSSLEAAEITPDLLDLMADLPERICPHLHIPLQSGSDSVLSRMRRRWTIGQFAAQCEAIRRRVDEPALTTDVIVGFPGESETDFEASCRVVREVGFSRVHVFRFSAREGTLAAALPDQVTPPVKQRRAEVMSEIDRQLRLDYRRKLLGRRLQVVCEAVLNEHPGVLRGTTDRYVTAQFPGGRELMERIVHVTADRVLADGTLDARLQPPPARGRVTPGL
jgi:threonylcarbamoyladenosine tRNA methylthiotransferase MtaB